MKDYEVKFGLITEDLSFQISVVANSPKEAVDKATENQKNGVIEIQDGYLTRFLAINNVHQIIVIDKEEEKAAATRRTNAILRNY